MDGGSTPGSMRSASDEEYDLDDVGFESPRKDGQGGFSIADIHMMPNLEKKWASYMNVVDTLKKKKDNPTVTEDPQEAAAKREVKWDKALEELVDTERKYINDLKLIKSIFVTPLQKSCDTGKPILDPKLIQTIFSEIDMFLKLHEEQFLPGLERERTQRGREVGKFFLAVASFLKIYTAYINKYEEITIIVRREEVENAAFKQFLNDCYKRPECDQLKIDDFLIKPLHRLTRYALLLRELERNCQPDNAKERVELQRAVVKVSEVTTVVNDRLRDAENRRKVVSVSEELQGKIPDLIQPFRRFVSEYVLANLNVDGTVGSNVNVYVFNDLVVTASKVREFFTESFVIRQFEIATMLLQLNIPDARGPNPFRMFDKEGSALDLCSTDEAKKSNLAIDLIRNGVLLEGVPYPHARQQNNYPSCNVLVIGERDSGKTALLKTLKSSIREAYAADPLLQQERMFVHAGDAIEPFVIPLALNGVPHNVTVTDTYGDERSVPEHKKENRELWKRGDVIVFVLNAKKDCKPDYWKQEISAGTFRRSSPPLVLVNAHESKEPQPNDATSLQIHRTLSATVQFNCVTSQRDSVVQAISLPAGLVATTRTVKKSMTFLGVSL